ncbi:MAG: hypothetical protein PHI06_12465 [Desulfobulbaceae bacterium]|nr:hypothetical protein [Desulfobulbaceae bacterium]
MVVEFQGPSKPDSGDHVGLEYRVDGEALSLELGGTILSMLNLGRVSTNDLGALWVKVIEKICLNHAVIAKKISVDSDGARVDGRTVLGREEIERLVGPQSIKG